MKSLASLSFLAIGAFALCLTTAGRALSAPQATRTIDLKQAIGKWHSAEQFEGESRLTFAFRRTGRSVEGWAVLLGQHRKGDDRATLALSFCDAVWDGQRFRFSTILPEDEGTTGWELRLTSPTAAVLRPLSDSYVCVPDI